MHRPLWLPREFRLVEKSLAYRTTRRIRGVDVSVSWIWGRPWGAMQIEYEQIVFFSNAVVLIYFNGRKFCDTTDRIGEPFTITKCDRMEIQNGEQSVFYYVMLSEGVSLADVERDLEKIWASETSKLKSITVDGELWRRSRS